MIPIRVTNLMNDNMQTVGFYNLENLFHPTENHPTTERNFLSSSSKKWTSKRYQNKISKLAYALSRIGEKETGKHPAIVGLAEVESVKALTDLITSEHLKDHNYQYIHYKSPDKRGINVAFLYDARVFEVIHSEIFPVTLVDKNGASDYTRDILWVSGLLDGETIHVIVNHWSSRYTGEQETEYKRFISSQKVVDIITKINKSKADAKIIVMGDFNDNPINRSLEQLVETTHLHNPMKSLWTYNRGSYFHNRQWHLFDQILMTSNFLKPSGRLLKFHKASILDAPFLRSFSGRHKGVPFRTYVGKKHTGGYSDHFPVYIILKK